MALSARQRTKVQDIVSEQLTGIKGAIVDDGEELALHGADSLDMVELAMELEDAFGLDEIIPADQMIACKTLGDVVALVDRLAEGDA